MIFYFQLKFMLMYPGLLISNILKCFQVCVVQSVHRGPITNDYAVTGTTFAPEGMIFDSAGMQVNCFSSVFPF